MNPPPRRMQTPQAMAIIMKRSDLDEDDSPADALFAIAFASPKPTTAPSPQKRRQRCSTCER